MTVTEDLKTNPLSVCVYPRVLKEFLDILGQPMIKATKGRCIHVYRRAGFPLFGELAVDLLGWNRPCDEFHVVGSDLYARLKIISQVAADNNAGDVDEAFGDFGMAEAVAGISTDGLRSGVFDMSTTARSGSRNGRKAKTKWPEGAATFVKKAIEARGAHRSVEINELIEAVRAAMPPQIDGEGKDRSRRNISKAISKLVELELLFLHDGTRVSLTALVAEDA